MPSPLSPHDLGARGPPISPTRSAPLQRSRAHETTLESRLPHLAPPTGCRPFLTLGRSAFDGQPRCGQVARPAPRQPIDGLEHGARRTRTRAPPRTVLDEPRSCRACGEASTDRAEFDLDDRAAEQSRVDTARRRSSPERRRRRAASTPSSRAHLDRPRANAQALQRRAWARGAEHATERKALPAERALQRVSRPGCSWKNSSVRSART